MNIQELKNELQELNIPERSYSLTGYVKPDALILYPKDEHWDVFYVDERGGRHDEKTNATESAACEDFLKRFKGILDTAKKFGIRAF